MWNRSLLLVIAALLVTSNLVLADKFAIEGHGKATALVKNKELNLKVETGSSQDYSSMKSFTLTIGGCEIAATVTLVGNVDLFFKFKLNGEEGTSNNPNKFTVKDDKFQVLGKATSEPLKCGFDFQAYNDQFKIDVAVSEGLPGSFKLSSDDADTFTDPKTEGSTMGGGAIAGIVIACIAVPVAVSAAVGTGVFFVRRRRKQEEAEKVKRDIRRNKKSDAKVAITPDQTTPATPEVKQDDKTKEDEGADRNKKSAEKVKTLQANPDSVVQSQVNPESVVQSQINPESATQSQVNPVSVTRTDDNGLVTDRYVSKTMDITQQSKQT